MSYPRFKEVKTKISETTEGTLIVQSPGVGILSNFPREGSVLIPGDQVGKISVLGRITTLVLPAGITGRVAKCYCINQNQPVEFEETILALVPIKPGESLDLASNTSEESISSDLPEGTFPIVSQTHGMFYRRSSPEAPLYVKPGQIVESGATLALVEVMKCFSPITYGGNGVPNRAEVVEIRADDGAEIESEQILFVMRPSA